MNYKEQYLKFKKEIVALRYALWMIGWDSQTEMPDGAHDYRIKQSAVLNKRLLDLSLDPKRVKAIKELNNSTLTQPFKREIELEYKSLLRILKIPKEELLEYQILIAEASQIYKKAKTESDFSIFEETLDKIIQYNKKRIKYLETDELKGYDVLLNMYHEGMKVEDYDKFFNLIKEKIVPFTEQITSKEIKYHKVLEEGFFQIDKQREFNNYLLKTLGYDLNHGLLKESLHPFTSSVTAKDVRITTAYSENDLQAAIFSTIHEMGHAIYEQQTSEEYIETVIEHIESYAMHESQSRLYENMIGRSYEFWVNHYGKLKEIFNEELKDVSLKDFYKYINKVEKGFVRVNADELTYSIHVMIRYEIEKAIFNDNLPTNEIKDLWNKLYKENLGLTVKSDQEGVLQDIHWSGGSFGYFPSYSLGSAISAQLYNTMNQEIDVNKLILNGEINIINDWLKKHVHQHGSFKSPNEIIYNCTKEEFNPNYYVNYLIEKYKKIYKI